MGDNHRHWEKSLRSMPDSRRNEQPAERSSHKNTDETESQRVKALRSAVDSGQYRIAFEAVAEAMVERLYSDSNGASG